MTLTFVYYEVAFAIDPWQPDINPLLYRYRLFVLRATDLVDTDFSHRDAVIIYMINCRKALDLGINTSVKSRVSCPFVNFDFIVCLRKSVCKIHYILRQSNCLQ